MVEWSIAAFRAAESVRSIVVACPPGHVHELGGHDLAVVDGGETRAASVSNALEAVGTELVAIHDAARPLVTAALVEAVLATFLADAEADGAIAATQVTDTIKRTAPSASGDPPSASAPPQSGGPEGTSAPLPLLSPDSGALVIGETIDRGRLWAAQTPQVFRVEALRRALEVDPARAAAATDEAMLLEAAGGRVLIHPAPPENVKVTTPFDLRVAELLLAERSRVA
jgi:2-C-methyl-D-erythritol 4-phosphate cytidylyltransferase